MGTLRFASAVLATALLVPCFGSGIQGAIIAARNGHGLGLVVAFVEGFSALPLAILAAPFQGVGATILGAFSLGLERLLRRGSIWIWIVHGLAVGCLYLLAFFRHDPSALIVNGVLGSWALAGVVMWAMLSGRTADDDPWGPRSYSSSSS